jgi:hypothetical protein
MDKPDSREMYGEIATLIASLAKALVLTDAETIAALERGEIAVDFGQDANTNKFVAATYQGRTVRIYQGAIRHAESPSTT